MERWTLGPIDWAEVCVNVTECYFESLKLRQPTCTFLLLTLRVYQPSPSSPVLSYFLEQGFLPTKISFYKNPPLLLQLIYPFTPHNGSVIRIFQWNMSNRRSRSLPLGRDIPGHWANLLQPECRNFIYTHFSTMYVGPHKAWFSFFHDLRCKDWVTCWQQHVLSTSSLL